MQPIQLSNISTDKISNEYCKEKDIEISVLRLDRIHPLVSGNKWFKLQFYLAAAIKEKKNTILTYGGYWSNHLLATAALCNINGVASIGIVRGEHVLRMSTTLEQAKALGMKLVFTDRGNYCQKKIPGHINLEDTYIINEGGYGKLGAAGAATILNNCDRKQFTHICCAVGTGTMMAGLISASFQKQLILGFSVLKNNQEAIEKIKLLLPEKHQNFKLLHDYHFGGYAKQKDDLICFMNRFYTETQIPTDIVYTGKLFFGVFDLIRKGYFTPGSNILIIHSGGLQGNDSQKKGTLIF